MRRRAVSAPALLVLGFAMLLAALLLFSAAAKVWELALAVKRSSVRGQQEHPQYLWAFVYDKSLCAKLRGLNVDQTPKLLIWNSGQKPLVVDSIFLVKGGSSRDIGVGNGIELDGGEYRSWNIQDVCSPGQCSDVQVHVHTTDGIYVIGGYAIPDPSVFTEGRGSACREP
ncbi:MAG: hypothetical protein QXP81_09635 [Nitrososphaerota archaeon]